MQRRNFIKAGASGILVPLTVGSLAGIAPAGDKSKPVSEDKRLLPVVGSYDVVVCGAGPAGVTAAIQSGRNGAKTLLIEVSGCLGGIWTTGLLSWIIDHSNKQGTMRELNDRLTRMGAKCDIATGNYLAYDVEAMKLLLEEMCAEAGVDILLHTRVVSALKSKSRRLTHVVTESKSGREAWHGKVFIDATGDGDLAALAGCGFDFGDPSDGGAFQPMSLLAFIGGVGFEQVKPFVRWAGDQGSASKQRLYEAIRKSGIDPSYTKPGIYPVSDGMFMMMANHEYGYSALNSRDITKATLHARKEVNAIVNGLKSLGGEWKGLKLIATAGKIGIREGRRIHGLYTVTEEDLINGTVHPDGVCRVTFGVDVHSVRRAEDKGTAGYSRGIKSKPYDIPLRALIAKDVEGLMMAGRCISGDFIAHSSYRVTGNSVILGEAAGKVASLAAQSNRLPSEVKWEEAFSKS